MNLLLLSVEVDCDNRSELEVISVKIGHLKPLLYLKDGLLV